jgi:UDP-N-acetylglucosamine 2-epimerase
VQRNSIVVVLGNRPQFIKHAAFHRAWADADTDLRLVLVDTGQHYDFEMSGIFLDELAMPAPDHSLQVGSASHAEQLARMLVPLEELLLREKPLSVVVYGDTNSTLGGVLAGAKLDIPVAHIEAGLRSYDRAMPEELNRVLSDHASSLLYAPTQVAVDNLAREGISGGHVYLTGDVMADVAVAITPAADRAWETLQEKFALPQRHGFALATIHRAANTKPGALAEVVECLAASTLPVVLPLHPRTQAALERDGLHVRLFEIPGIRVLPPLGYVHLASLTRAARVVITDSGGLQKEAYVHGTPCVTVRDTTEWTETLDTGLNVLVDRDPSALAAAVERAATGELDAVVERRPNLYGDGSAAVQIVETLLEHAAAAAHLAL